MPLCYGRGCADGCVRTCSTALRYYCIPLLSYHRASQISLVELFSTAVWVLNVHRVQNSAGASGLLFSMGEKTVKEVNLAHRCLGLTSRTTTRKDSTPAYRTGGGRRRSCCPAG